MPVCLVFTAAQTKPPAKPKAAAKDLTVIDVQGFRELLQQNRGKPLLVNFWATWCQPCQVEYPMINELAGKYSPQGLRVIGISLVEDAEINLVRPFLERNAPIFPNDRKRRGDEQTFDRAVDARWNGAATFLFSRDGHLFARLIGGYHREDVEKAIQALLAASASSPPANEPKNHP